MNNMELLAPAGGMAELRSAVQSGADAVYLGASMFSARSGAGNFDEAEMKAAVEYAHVYGVKVHCAINTLIKETELPAAIETAVSANRCGADALIIQDIGFASHIRKLLPDMELHASTQMTVTSLEGVRYLEKHGFSRVVLSRELSLDEIKYIAKNSVAEIEVFVHGAICMSYSGQCLMSSILGGRSGNRGKCAQPCRLPYELMENSKSCGSGYILSPKDMALINHLHELKKAGVASLKIEGRLKSAEYVSAVVGMYRKYLDSPHKVADNDMKELVNAFSRSGFTDGYLTGKLGERMMAHNNPANNSGSIFTPDARLRASGKYIRKIPIDLYMSLEKNDVVRLTAYTEDGKCVACEGETLSETAVNRSLDKDRVAEQLKKMGDTPFMADTITIELAEGITIPIREINEVRRKLSNELWREFSYRDNKRINDTQLEFNSNAEISELYLTAEVMTYEQGEAVIKADGVKRIYAPSDVAPRLKKCTDKIEIVTRTSDILDNEDISTNAVSVPSLGAMERYDSLAIYGEWRLNVYNSLTVRELSKLSCVTISPELNLYDIKNIAEHTNGVELEIIGYGRLPLMLMRNCPIKAMGKCQNHKNIYTLKDRKGMEFPIICQKDCRSVLLNSKPVYTADMISNIRYSKINCIRLNFTVEKPTECGKIIEIYKKALRGEAIPQMPENTFTRGHLKRGV